jgi:hypothetical protein
MNDKQENLLSVDEIRWVENALNNIPALKHPFVIGEVSHRLSILKITSEKGLVFIWGDNNTGFNHLNDRHSYWSEKTYWETNNGKIKLGDPSKFSKESLPIFDYFKISEAIYVEGNLNTEKNKHPEIFDVYIGEVEDESKKLLRYRMVLYKGTKIVHTLFPEQLKHNKKRVEINLRRGRAKGMFYIEQGKLDIEVPYYDNNDVAIYSLQSCRDFNKKLEIGFLISHQSGKRYNLFDRQLENLNMLEYESEIEKVDLANLSKVEKCIKELEK